MPSSVTRRPDGTYAVEILGGPPFLVLTGSALSSLIAALVDAGLVLPPRLERER